MKRIFIAAVLLFVVGAVRAQKVYFIYIQSDSHTPFFVKIGEKVTSSTASGYLILPKLVDSVYQFTVGKTGQAATESRFSITIAKKDHGFLLREADGKFSLFDLQTMTALQPLAATNTQTEIIGKRTDAFTTLLAQAANDPSLLEIRAAPAVIVQTETEKKAELEPVTAVVKQSETETFKPEPEADTAQATTTVNAAPPVAQEPGPTDLKTDSSTQNNTATQQTTPVQEDSTTQQTQTPDVKAPETNAIADAQIFKRSMVTRRSESSTSEGFGLLFWDETDGIVDTIRIIIPNQSIVAQKEEVKDEDSKKFLDIAPVDTTEKDATVHRDDLRDISVTEKPLGIATVDATKENVTVAAANEKIRVAERKAKRCGNEADEKDFFKLRKNMAAEETDEAMIKEAQKAFKRSCFSTAQIKNLSTLFLDASGKYQFFDAAYGHVLDKEQYAMLQSELTDDYYKNRFKALIAQQ